MTTNRKKENSIEDEILTRNHLTTYRNVELARIEMASYWQKRKKKVAYYVWTKYFLLKSLPSFCTYRKHRETHAKLCPDCD